MPLVAKGGRPSTLETAQMRPLPGEREDASERYPSFRAPLLPSRVQEPQDQSRDHCQRLTGEPNVKLHLTGESSNQVTGWLRKETLLGGFGKISLPSGPQFPSSAKYSSYLLT